jgi:hypothetical protein
MPTFGYGAVGFSLARSRNHYVAYGLNSVARPTRHGPLRNISGIPVTGVSVRETLRVLERGLDSETIELSRQQGHVTTAERCPTARCEERFLTHFNDATDTIEGAWYFSRLSTMLSDTPFNFEHPRPARPHLGGYPPAPRAHPSLPDLRLPALVPVAGSLGPLESVGFELECGVPSSMNRVFERFVSYGSGGAGGLPHGGYDSSVTVSSPYVAREATFWSRDLAQLCEWLKVAYEQVHVITNSSCGFHVHVKAAERDRWVFATRFYWDAFLTGYRLYAAGRYKYLRRLSAYYSRARPWSASFVHGLLRRDEERYTAINLQSLVKHPDAGTVEHRIFPHQETLEEAQTTIRWVSNIAGTLVSAPQVPLTDGEVEVILENRRFLAPNLSPSEFEAEVARRRVVRQPTPSALPFADLSASSSEEA